MGNELLINDGIVETRIALVHDGRLDDLIVERRDRPSIVGSVFYGRVSRVLSGLDVAFVNIGAARDGFLRAPDAQYARPKSDGPTTQRGITRRVAEGEAIIVQVVADAYADKGAKLTTDISLRADMWCTRRTATCCPSRDESRMRASASGCRMSLMTPRTPPSSMVVSSFEPPPRMHQTTPLQPMSGRSAKSGMEFWLRGRREMMPAVHRRSCATVTSQ